MTNHVLLPTPTPYSATDLEALKLIADLHSKSITTTQGLLLTIAMGIPGPLSLKLTVYNMLVKLPLPVLSPQAFTVILLIGPYIFFALLFLFILFLRRIPTTIIPFIVSKFPKEAEKKVFLSLSFPSDTSKSSYATEQLYSLLHTLARQKDFWSNLRHDKNEYSLEIVSTKQEGIRYVLVTGEKFSEIIKRNLLSYLPGIQIKEVADYLPSYVNEAKKKDAFMGVEEFKLSGHFTLSLETQKTLKEHDPISYLTGNMTKLDHNELISFQVITTPILSTMHERHFNEMNRLKHKLVKGEPLSPVLQKNGIQQFLSLPGISILWFVIKIPVFIIWNLFTFFLEVIATMVNEGGPTMPQSYLPQKIQPQQLLNPYEQEVSTVVKEKIDQKLFETSIRLLVLSKNPDEVTLRLNGLLASFGQLSSTYQSFTTKSGLFSPKLKKQLEYFQKRTLSPDNVFHRNPILSTSEISDVFHFPYTGTTKTEDMIKVHSNELPAPLSVKNTSEFDVVLGKNTYAGSTVDIGLSDDDRSRHVYLIGQTGSGKSTIIYHMARQDIQKGRGVAIIDPHGDLAEDLLGTVPETRKDDVIYFNPFDVKYPIGVNLLELTPHLDEDEMELEKELVCESVISIFRRIFSKDETVDAHRIEYILRNTIYTAFTVKDCTIFTVYDLLNNPKFQKSVIKNLTDENLKNFWKNEFGRAGNFQIVKMVSGVTARIGRFLFSPIAKRILEQSRSTINFDDILESGKILICNLAEGKLGEDTSTLLGTTIIAKIQQATMRRARTRLKERRPFYLFVDEFQNFATPSFTKLLSGGRKFGLRITIAEQSTSQQSDRSIVNVILANTGTVICFRTASPVDESLMLSQFSPYITAGEIPNLARFHFYMKMSAIEPEEPFSGITLPMNGALDHKHIDLLIEHSRKNYATPYIKPKNDVAKDDSSIMSSFSKSQVISQSNMGLPKKKKVK